MKLNILRYEKRLCIGMVASMAVSMAVIHGFFWGGAQFVVFVFWEWQKKRKNVKKSLTRNFSVYMLKNMVSIIVPLITIPYVSRILGPSGLGDVQYTQSWVSYFSLIAGLGISSYAVREGAQRRDEPQKLGEFSVEIVTISFLSTTVAYLSFAIFLCFFKTTGAQPSLFLVFSLLIGATGLNTEWICTVLKTMIISQKGR